MDDRGSWKVGLITILAIVGTLAMLAFLVTPVHDALTGGRWNFYVVFNDVGGLQAAEKVELAGVTVGEVDSVELVDDPNSGLARLVVTQLQSEGFKIPQYPFVVVKLNMNQDAKGRLYRYYSYQVGSTSIIGTQHVVTITPVPSRTGMPIASQKVAEDNVVPGQPTMSLTDLTTPAIGMMNAVTGLTQKMQGLVADPRLKQELLASANNMQAATGNLKLVTDQARDLAQNANASIGRSLPRIGQSLDNVEATTANIHSATDRLPAMMDQAQGSLGAVQANLVLASKHADVSVQNLNATSAKLKTFITESGTLEAFHDTMANFKDTSGQLNGVIGDLHTMTSDPRMKQDIPAILDNLKNASAELAPTIHQMKDTLGTFNSLGQTANTTLGTVNGILPHKEAPGTPHPPAPARQKIGVNAGLGFFYSGQTTNREPTRLAVDPELQLSFGGNLYYLGIYDVGGQNRITAEIGHRLLGDDLAGLNYRYGLYRGRVGVGTDWILNPNIGIYTSLYDPNLPTLDLEGALDLGDQRALWAGIDELNRRPRYALGFRVKL